jgi:arsenate reductase-like glutaredoxin family protein
MKIYTLPTCSACKLLTRYLDSNNIKYEEIDADEGLPEGKKGIPLIEKDGVYLEGFNKDKVDKLLGIKQEDSRVTLSRREKEIIIKSLNMITIPVGDPEGFNDFKTIIDIKNKLQ